MARNAIFLSALNRGVQLGYMRALKACGWTVSQHHPLHRLGLGQVLRDQKTDLVFANEKFDSEHLPLDIINSLGISVCLERVPSAGMQIPCADYPTVDHEHTSMTAGIKRLLSYTHIEPDAWPVVFGSNTHGLCNIPFAGDLCAPLAQQLPLSHGFACLMNLVGKEEIGGRWLLPLLRRMRGAETCVLAGDGWQTYGIAGVPPLPDEQGCNHAYASSRYAVNSHYTTVRTWQMYVAPRTFAIALAGGEQIADMPLVRRYIGPYAITVEDPTSLIQLIEGAATNLAPKTRRRNVIENARFVANNHTYFHRLAQMFEALSWQEEAASMRGAGARYAQKWLWGFETNVG